MVELQFAWQNVNFLSSKEFRCDNFFPWGFGALNITPLCHADLWYYCPSWRALAPASKLCSYLNSILAGGILAPYTAFAEYLKNGSTDFHRTLNRKDNYLDRSMKLKT